MRLSVKLLMQGYKKCNELKEYLLLHHPASSIQHPVSSIQYQASSIRIQYPSAIPMICKLSTINYKLILQPLQLLERNHLIQ